MDRLTLPILVSLFGIPSMFDLEMEWRQLEAHSEGSFFTSWAWIGCWLKGLKGLKPSVVPMLLRATRNDEVVGLALLVHHNGRCLKVLPERRLYLHATGNLAEDAITIEHNGFRTHYLDSEAIAAAMYRYLLRDTADWQQLVLPGLPAHPTLGGPLPSSLVLRERVQKSYVVDLDAVRRNDGDYFGALSSNTRNQIRRSIKAFEKLGPLRLTGASDVHTAMAYLAGLKVLHERRWASLGKQGSFSNASFEAFHSRLIDENFLYGAIQLLCVQAGDRVIGYLYNFVYRGRVLFYQSGFDYELLPGKSRPGLVTHTLAVRHNAELGHHTYDFLAGDTRYKRSLSTQEETMYWVSVHRNTMAFRLENVLRLIKRGLFKAEPPAPVPEPAASTVTAMSSRSHLSSAASDIIAPREPQD